MQRRRSKGFGSNIPVTSMSNSSMLHCFTNSSLYPQFFTCFDYSVSSNIFIVLTYTNILLLPIYFLVLVMGFQRWRHQFSAKSGMKRHSDVFMYYIVTVDIINVFGSFMFFVAIYTCSQWLKMVGCFCFVFAYPGQIFFHCLACVERYLAVVHPITYRACRPVHRVRITNISIGCVLLLCFVSVGVTALYFPDIPIPPLLAIFGFTIFVAIFCSLSVLHVLIRLGLGKVGRDGEQIDQSKQKAFYTIIVVTGALVLMCCGLLVCNISLLKEIDPDGCVIIMSGLWMCLPSSLVLPLLFLHREGHLRTIK